MAVREDEAVYGMSTTFVMCLYEQKKRKKRTELSLPEPAKLLAAVRFRDA